MSRDLFRSDPSSATEEAAVRSLYRDLLDAWNQRDAEGFAAAFVENGSTIGFDGSQHDGRETIAREIGSIFANHQTGKYVGKVRDVQLVTADVAILRAVSAIMPAGQLDLNPATNALQTNKCAADNCRRTARRRLAYRAFPEHSSPISRQARVGPATDRGIAANAQVNASERRSCIPWLFPHRRSRHF